MFRYDALPATEDFQVDVTEIVTLENLNRNGFELAAQVAVSQAVYPITAPEDYQKLTGPRKQRAEAIIRGVQNIAQGLPFTAFSVKSDELTGLVIQSSSRNHQYIVTADSCQCEGHKNHGNCFHRALFPVFNIYFGLVRAHESFRRFHAKLGIELRIVPDVPQIILFGGMGDKTLDEMYDQILRDDSMEGVRGS